MSEFRNSRWLFAAHALPAIPRLIMLWVGMLVTYRILPFDSGPVPAIVAAIVGVAVVAEPFVDVFLKAVILGERSLVAITRGPFASTREIEYSRITSVHVESSWSLRSFGLERVVVDVSGSRDSRLTMRGMKAAETLRFRALVGVDASTVEQAPNGGPLVVDETTPESPLQPVAASARLVQAHAVSADGLPYVIDRADLVSTVLLRGTFAVAAITSVFAFDDWAGMLGLDMSSVRSSLLATSALIAFALVLGVVFSVLRYRGFSMARLPSGALEVVYGAFPRVSHTLTPSAVLMVTVRRGLVDQLMGRVRMEVATARMDGGVGQVLFPAIRLTKASALASAIAGVDLPVTSVLRRRGAVPIQALVALTPCAVALLVPTHWVVRLAAAMVALLVAARSAAYVTGRENVHEAHGFLTWTDISLAVRARWLLSGATRAMVSYTVFGWFTHIRVVGYAHRGIKLGRPLAARLPLREARLTALTGLVAAGVASRLGEHVDIERSACDRI